MHIRGFTTWFHELMTEETMLNLNLVVSTNISDKVKIDDSITHLLEITPILLPN
jgi:hypothetical protein